MDILKSIRSIIGVARPAGAGHARSYSRQPANRLEQITQEEQITIRGGDKEYNPSYDEKEDRQWQHATSLFETL